MEWNALNSFSVDSKNSKGNVIKMEYKLITKAIWKCNVVNLSRYYIFGRLAWLDRTASTWEEIGLGVGNTVIITSLYTTKGVFTEEGTIRREVSKVHTIRSS